MSDGTRPIEWVILIVTILGFIIQPVLIYFLEKRRDERLKELEKNEKLFSKTLDEVKNFLNGLEKDQKFMLEFTEDLKEWTKDTKEKLCPDCRKLFGRVWSRKEEN